MGYPFPKLNSSPLFKVTFQPNRKGLSSFPTIFQGLLSRQLIYPPPKKHLESMMFQLPKGGICMDMLVLWRVCWNFRGVNLPTSTGFLHISNLLKVKLWDLETGWGVQQSSLLLGKRFSGGGGGAKKGRFSYNHGEVWRFGCSVYRI